MIGVVGPTYPPQLPGRVIAVNRGAPIKVLSSQQHQDHVDAMQLLGLDEMPDAVADEPNGIKVGDLLAVRIEGRTALTIVTVTSVNVNVDSLSITAAQYPDRDCMGFNRR